MEEIENMLRPHDSNGDGKISFEEFEDVFFRHRPEEIVDPFKHSKSQIETKQN